MSRYAMLSLVVAALSLTLTPVLEAKPPTVKIAVEGGNLFWPLEITEPQILDMSNIWTGRLFDVSRDTAADAPRGMGRYEVSLYVDESYGLRKAYVIYYRPGRAGSTGYVYLPGVGDAWRTMNSWSILRDGRDGRWSYASPEWEARIKPLIARAEREQRARVQRVQAQADSMARAKSGTG